ncbi:hypothetical protein ACJ41O_006608 [Fusarium nematophilum]
MEFISGAALLAGAVVVGGIAATGTAVARGIMHRRRRRRANELGEATYTHRSNFVAEASAREEDERRKVHLVGLAKKCLDQERDTTRGEPVYFSRRIRNGEFDHWVIACYGKKFELRLDTSRRDVSGALLTSLPPTKKWVLKKDDWGRLPDLMAHRHEIMESEAAPTPTATAASDLMKAKFGAEYRGYYVFGFHDCQSFVRGFAEYLISPTNRALDYNWFNENAEGDYATLLRMKPDSSLYEYQYSLVQARLRQQQGQNQRQAQQEANGQAKRAGHRQQQQQQQFAAFLSQVQQDTILQYNAQQGAAHNRYTHSAIAHHNSNAAHGLHNHGDIHAQTVMDHHQSHVTGHLHGHLAAHHGSSMGPMGSMGQP